MSMSVARSPIVRDQFLIGYALQREWAWLIAAAFFFGKVGAGLFVVSYFTDFRVGALVGLLMVGVGKSTAHLMFLGRPERFLRAVVGWRSSRLSQGLITMGVFLVCGVVYLAASGAAQEAFGVVAVAAATVLMFWEGFLLRASRGIPLWGSWLLPLLALLYSLLGGTTMVLVLRSITGSEATEAQLEWMQLSLLALNLVLVATYVSTVQVRSAAAQLGVHMLTRGPLGVLFLAGAVGIGLVATLVLGCVAALTDSMTALTLTAVTDLFGHFLIFFALLRAGIYAPLRPVPLLAARAAGGE